jgi:RNA polymerase sigma factor FliA
MPAGSVSTHRKHKVTRTMRDRIVLDHLPLVKAIAVRVHENLPVHVDVDDLFHAGVLGLFDAAAKYNPDKKVVFSAYAKHRIKGAILDSLRQLDWASRDQRRRQKQVESATRELTSTLGRLPTEGEVANSLGYNAERWRRVAMELRMVGVFSSSLLPGEQNNGLQPEFPARPDSQPDMMCEHEQLRHTLARAVKTLPERYQKVVVLYYTNEMTMKEIGDLIGVNESRVSQIHKTALKKMAVALQSEGIHSAEAF